MSAFKLIASLVVLSFLTFTYQTRADQKDTNQQTLSQINFISEAEFRATAEELSKKVNLFQRAWQIDPNAEFFGGTTRDFLYWVKRRLGTPNSREEALQRIESLKKFNMIDVREFIVQESDVDVVTGLQLNLSAEEFGIKKIDSINSDRLKPNTPLGQNEIHQGFIPVEKIRLGQSGFVSEKTFGDGIHEIFTGILTVHFSNESQFKSTHYARQKLNHPILLALRYLRLLAANYYATYGSGYPDTKILFAIDPKSSDEVAKVITQAKQPGALSDFLKNSTFARWLNNAVQKAFRCYTNPTAAFLLFQAFKVNDLLDVYSEIHPYNQFLFAKLYDQNKVSENFKTYGLQPEDVYIPVEKAFPGLTLYHGTKTEENFRAILFQGILGSVNGNAGGGLYGVSKRNIRFAIDWGGSVDRVVKFEIVTSAKIIDITTGKGKFLYEQFAKSPPQKNAPARMVDAFAEAFGVDIISYPYLTEAFVVKNSAVLKKPTGYTRQIMTFGRLLDLAKSVENNEQLSTVMQVLELNSYSTSEKEEIFSNIPLYQDLLKTQIQTWEEAGITNCKSSLMGVILTGNALLSLDKKDNSPTSKLVRKKLNLSFLNFMNSLIETSSKNGGIDAETFRLFQSIFTNWSKEEVDQIMKESLFEWNDYASKSLPPIRESLLSSARDFGRRLKVIGPGFIGILIFFSYAMTKMAIQVHGGDVLHHDEVFMKITSYTGAIGLDTITFGLPTLAFFKILLPKLKIKLRRQLGDQRRRISKLYERLQKSPGSQCQESLLLKTNGG